MEHPVQLPPITVCTEDRDRLDSLLSTYEDDVASETVDRLAGELERAEVVVTERLPPGVVRMNSRVKARDLDTGDVRRFELVYPEDADPRRHRVSVFAPAGCAVLGLAEGQRISWPLRGHRSWRVEVVSVQPRRGIEPMANVNRDDRWQHLLSAALSVGEAREPRREMERRLTSLLEVFSSDLDPVDDFEAYAVRRFVQVVRGAAQGSG